MRFTKMHGLGNDYVYVNGFAETIDDPSAVARRVADRHFGVGGDGMILILPPRSNVPADVRMRMFNADGSEGEMCGNGVRCVAKYAFDHGLSRNNPLRVETGRGVLSLALTLGRDGKVSHVAVDMDEPILESARIPTRMLLPKVINQPLVELPDVPASAGWRERCGLDARMTCVSMGNPHVVIFCKHVDRVPLDVVGPQVETHPMFPARINVHFAEVIGPSEVKMRTWERGSGITLACGTGACAVVVAGALTSRLSRKALVHLPGGDLQIEWRDGDNHVIMTGPATEVFNGEWVS